MKLSLSDIKVSVSERVLGPGRRKPPSAVLVAFAFCFFMAICGGCGNGSIPDPNDPNEAGIALPEVLRNDLKGASDSLYDRVRTGELTDKQAQDYLAKYADSLIEHVKIDKVPHDKAWEYAEVFRTARRWKQAKLFLEVAVKYAKDEDRRVNDSLRLAQVDAQLDDVTDAIKLVRSTFTTTPVNKAPILIGTLLEVVPAAQGKGHDLQLAKLLEDAIPQAMQTLVDPTAESGKAFLLARPHHVNHAWEVVEQLYTSAGRPDLAQQAARLAAKPESPAI